MSRPQASEYPTSYEQYISLVNGDNVIKVLEEQTLSIRAVLSSVDEDMEDHSYAPGKWTIKEVIGHIIDTERVVGYRVLRYVRGDESILPGFDSDMYVKNGNFSRRSLYDLAHEFSYVRGANIALFKTFDNLDLEKKGTADGKQASVRALLYMIAGHTEHHIKILRSKYLV
ncbi:MAG: DinB family protein [Bacteroidetes bacterium]|nr:DinB family protein [Bacteroidota bacterium]